MNRSWPGRIASSNRALQDYPEVQFDIAQKFGGVMVTFSKKQPESQPESLTQSVKFAAVLIGTTGAWPLVVLALGSLFSAMFGSAPILLSMVGHERRVAATACVVTMWAQAHKILKLDTSLGFDLEMTNTHTARQDAR